MSRHSNRGKRGGSAAAFLLLLGLAHCGGNNDPEPAACAGNSGVGGSAGSGGSSAHSAGEPPVGTCDTPSAPGYEPSWSPPRTQPGACTREQVAQEFALCEGGSLQYDEVACRTFEMDPANASCLGCMFSATGAPESGPILVLPGGYWLANVGGCEALLDGDNRESSCGARTQAGGICQYGACVEACSRPVSTREWNACLTSSKSACQAFDATACVSLPRYAFCQRANWHDYFVTYGDLFCVSGPDALEPSSAGGAGGAPTQ